MRISDLNQPQEKEMNKKNFRTAKPKSLEEQYFIVFNEELEKQKEKVIDVVAIKNDLKNAKLNRQDNFVLNSIINRCELSENKAVCTFTREYIASSALFHASRTAVDKILRKLENTGVISKLQKASGNVKGTHLIKYKLSFGINPKYLVDKSDLTKKTKNFKKYRNSYLVEAYRQEAKDEVQAFKETKNKQRNGRLKIDDISVLKILAKETAKTGEIFFKGSLAKFLRKRGLKLSKYKISEIKKRANERGIWVIDYNRQTGITHVQVNQNYMGKKNTPSSTSIRNKSFKKDYISLLLPTKTTEQIKRVADNLAEKFPKTVLPAQAEACLTKIISFFKWDTEQACQYLNKKIFSPKKIKNIMAFIVSISATATLTEHAQASHGHTSTKKDTCQKCSYREAEKAILRHMPGYTSSQLSQFFPIIKRACDKLDIQQLKALLDKSFHHSEAIKSHEAILCTCLTKHLSQYTETPGALAILSDNFLTTKSNQTTIKTTTINKPIYISDIIKNMCNPIESHQTTQTNKRHQNFIKTPEKSPKDIKMSLEKTEQNLEKIKNKYIEILTKNSFFS